MEMYVSHPTIPLRNEVVYQLVTILSLLYFPRLRLNFRVSQHTTLTQLVHYELSSSNRTKCLLTSSSLFSISIETSSTVIKSLLPQSWPFHTHLKIPFLRNFLLSVLFPPIFIFSNLNQSILLNNTFYNTTKQI